MYQLLLHRQVEKDLAKIPRNYGKRLVEVMRSLKQDPRPQQSIHLGEELYRMRVGTYRIIYAVFDHKLIVYVGKIGRRSEKTYRNLDDILRAAKRALDNLKE